MSSKKSFMPMMWQMWLIFYFILNIFVYIFVLKLSFADWSWENALSVTSMDRAIALLVLVLFCFNLWFMIGMIRILQRKWSELKLD